LKNIGTKQLMDAIDSHSRGKNTRDPSTLAWLPIFFQMKSSDAKASKCHLKFSSRMIIFMKLVYLSSVISLKWQ